MHKMARRLLVFLSTATLHTSSSDGSSSIAPIKTLLIPSLFDFQPIVLYINVDSHVAQLSQFCNFHHIDASRCHLLHEAVQSVVHLDGTSSCRMPRASELPAFLMVKGLIAHSTAPSKAGSTPLSQVTNTASFAWMQDEMTNIAADLCRFLESTTGSDAQSVESCTNPLAKAFESSLSWINSLSACSPDVGKREKVTVQERQAAMDPHKSTINDRVSSIEQLIASLPRESPAVKIDIRDKDEFVSLTLSHAQALDSEESKKKKEIPSADTKTPSFYSEAPVRITPMESSKEDRPEEILPTPDVEEQNASKETTGVEDLTIAAASVETMESPHTDDQSLDDLADSSSFVEPPAMPFNEEDAVVPSVVEQSSVDGEVQASSEATVRADEVVDEQHDADEVIASNADTPVRVETTRSKQVIDITSDWDKFSAAATLVVLFLIFYLTLDLVAIALYEIQQGGMEVLMTGVVAAMRWWPTRMTNAIKDLITWTAARYYAGSRQQQQAEQEEVAPSGRFVSLTASCMSFLPLDRWQLGSGLKPLRHVPSAVYPSIGLDTVRPRMTLTSPPLSPRSTVSTVGSTAGNHRVKSFSVAKMALLCGRFASHVAPQARRHTSQESAPRARVLKELDELVTEERAVTALWDQLRGQELLERVREGMAARRLQRWWRLWLQREIIVQYNLNQEFVAMEGDDNSVGQQMASKNDKMDGLNSPSSRPSSPLLPSLERRYSTSTA